MAALDTNVLVRWLVDDDAAQSARVQQLLDAARADDAQLFVPSTVMLELEWVLRSLYGFDKEAVTAVVTALLETQELQLQDQAAIEQALHWFREHRVDFADCLHAAMCTAVGSAPLMTFDARASRLPGSRMMPP